MRILIFLILLLLAAGSMGQRIVENPRFGSSTSETRKITRIELTDTATVFYVDAVYRPHWWIKVEAGISISPANGGEKLLLKATEGITVDKEFFMPASGKHSYKLIFPALPAGVTRIDMWEEDSSEGGIFDVALTDEKEQRLFPEELKGNWLKTDGSGEWVYSFEDLFAVADGDFWEYADVTNKGRVTEFHLKRDGQEKTIYVRIEKNGQVRIGKDKKNLELYIQKRQVNIAAAQEQPEKTDVRLLKNDTAVLKGFVKGYSPKMGKGQAIVYVDDLFSGNHQSREITIEEDGRFEIREELNYPQPLMMRFPFRMDFSVYMEPGKTTLMCLDMAQYIDPWRQAENVSERPKTSLFMGDNAWINHEYQACRSFCSSDYRKIEREVKGYTPEEFKQYVKNARTNSYARLSDYEKQQGISAEGKKMISYMLDLNACSILFDYDYFMRQIWEKENKNKKAEEKSPLKEPELGIDYYDFVRELKLGDESPVIVGGEFGAVMNRMKYSTPVGKVYMEMEQPDLKDELEKIGVQLTEKEIQFLEFSEQLKQKAEQDTALLRRLQVEFNDVAQEFVTKHGKEIQKILQKHVHKSHRVAMEKYFGIEPGFITDVMNLQDQIQLLDQSFGVMNEQQLEEIRKFYRVPFVGDYLVRHNDRIKATLEANKLKTGFIVHEIPAVENEKLFDTITALFKGKVIFVDFWATWCAPCRDGIVKMKSVKEELDGKDIVFVYITGETSPQKTYENMIPDIKGHHFRLSNEQWRYICEQFGVNGIPHYMLVDRSGEIVEKKFNGWQEKPAIKAALLKCLDKTLNK